MKIAGNAGKDTERGSLREKIWTSLNAMRSRQSFSAVTGDESESKLCQRTLA